MDKEIKQDIDEEIPEHIKAWIKETEELAGPVGMALNPKDSSDRMLHYNLERLRLGVNIKIDEEDLVYSKYNKLGEGKYIMPFSKVIIIGTDVAATLGMGFPIPRIFEEYIMNADKVQVTGEDSDAAKNAAAMTVDSKKVYTHDIGIDHFCLDHLYKPGISVVADAFMKNYDGQNWQCEYTHHMTGKQMAKALVMNIPVLTTQFYNKIYKGCHTEFEEMVLPHYYDVMEYMGDIPKHNSVEHKAQIERILLKLEKPGNAFYGITREQDFPLTVEDWVSAEEYNKRDEHYIINN